MTESQDARTRRVLSENDLPGCFPQASSRPTSRQMAPSVRPGRVERVTAATGCGSDPSYQVTSRPGHGLKGEAKQVVWFGVQGIGNETS